MDDNNKSPFKRIMVWVGSITAILTLIFGLQQLYTSLATHAKAKKEVTSLIQSSQVQLDAKDYDQAWKMLAEADQKGVMQDEIELAKVKTAMLWLRNMRATEKSGSFTEQAERILPTLSKATLNAKGQLLADIYAHMGWADFLRLRDGNSGLHPEINYKKALAVDSGNMYANAMLGHWLYWQHKDTDLGWQLFQTAAKSGRDLKYVRNMQFAALKNINYSNIDFLKLLQTMRLNGEEIDESMATHCLEVNYIKNNGFQRFGRALQTGEPVKSSIAPKDDLALFDWLCQQYPDFVKDYPKFRPFIKAILTEAMGDRDAAANMYRQLYAGLPDSNPTGYRIDEYLKNAIARTSSSH